jgi:sugar O-acyltransferase (sialic acid O-acetyltransferase NeuD family)
VTAKALRPIVILGIGELSQLAHFYFARDAGRHVAGFTVDAEFIRGERYEGLPLVPYQVLEQRFPPDAFDLFVAIGYSKLNTVRAERCARARAQGYRLASYVSTRASVWPDLELGGNCLVMEGNVIQPFAVLGEGVIVSGGNVISHHCRIGDYCYFGAAATISGGVTIGERSFIGSGATVREHLRVGRDCIVGAGTLILKDTADGSGYIASGTPVSGIPSNRLRNLL